MAKALLTRREASELSGVSLKRLEREIDAGVIVLVKLSHRATRLSLGDVHLLVVLRDLDIPLSVGTKHGLRHNLETLWRRSGADTGHWASAAGTDLHLRGPVFLRLTSDLVDRLENADEYARLRDQLVESIPGIRGGEPVIRGTRVPVRSLAEQVNRGETLDVLREDYPDVPEEAFGFAPIWARANPRRGRPNRPWRSE
jgi:uncharacterized protein (DUF433 family)